MPYTILVHGSEALARRVYLALANRDVPRSRFTATLTAPTERRATRALGAGWQIVVRPVRLKRLKPYCGQHPGECFVGGPRRRSACLEWEDWIEFNALVNDALDRLDASASVWSVPAEPLDHGSKFWLRRGTARRTAYDWAERPGPHGSLRPLRVWNHGSADQFEVQVRPTAQSASR